jgi:SpoVK/Ycf46/Vps4 family AAA+-type ATPase
MQILELYTKGIDSNIDLKDIAKRTHLFTGADLKGLCQDVIIGAIRRSPNIQTTNISTADFEVALEAFVPTLNFEMLQQYRTFVKSI